jgi:hypothetical protein
MRQPNSAPSGPQRPKSVRPQELVVSKFDKVSSLLLASVMFLGILVGMLFLLWLTSGKPKPIEVYPEIIENPAGRGPNAEGFERDFEPPGAEEVEDLLEPTVEDTLLAVTEAVSSVPASFEAVDSNVSATSKGAGQGDSRPPGPMGEGDDIIPRFERWKLKFVAKNLAAYAAQLDYYEIELAAIGGDIQGVDYAANVAAAPQTRRGPSEGEERLYFMWTTPGPLMQYDRQLLQKAGVQLTNRQMLKFIPKNLENMLANIELEFAEANGHSSVTEIAQTIFESRPAEGAYRFEVIDQKYRVPKKL